MRYLGFEGNFILWFCIGFRNEGFDGFFLDVVELWIFFGCILVFLVICFEFFMYCKVVSNIF